MLHKWRDLAFLHFSVEPEVIQSTLPSGLTVDTFEGKAWVGLVPFLMTGIRHHKLPCIPGTHTFPETNVRTYVHQDGEKPGVWFFSLDAANSLAVWGARKFYGLPYHRAEMQITKDKKILYRSVRRLQEASHRIEIQVGSPLPDPQPGSLEFFLVERYLLYSHHQGKISTGQVHHVPYPLHSASLLDVSESMIKANGLPERPWEHICFSPGVDVEVFGIQPT